MMHHKNTGQKLYKEAKKIIPNATGLFGKRSELYLPENWPAYYSKAKGCQIWDLDGRKYRDFTMVGIGANILGYSDSDVNRAAKLAIQRGSLTTLNPPEDVELAKILIGLHPWAEMVRFARTGGEINAIAVRIARAYSKKSHVAVCGYHGWHDWYLSANLGNKSQLDGHLLPGLNPLGVPREMSGLTHTFGYGDIKGLIQLVEKYNIGTVIMEPLRGETASIAFLSKVRDICSEEDIVLVFDEVTSGFREYIGGHHMLTGINPDIALFGKTISNGVPMAAAIGKSSIMEKACESFISSTYWTDRCGPSAAIAAIQKMQRIDSPRKLLKVGKEIRLIMKNAALNNNLDINFFGSTCLTNFHLNVDNWQESLTLYTQEMLFRGFLSADRLYSNISHKKKDLNKFRLAVNEVFKIINEANTTLTTKARLKGPTRNPSFGRVAIKNE